MRVAFVCSAVDEEDPVVANHVRWIRALAAAPGIEQVEVLALRSGSFDLPPQISVRTFGSRLRLVTAARFLACALGATRRGAAFFFICQGGAYPALLLPIKAVFRRPIYQWKAHPHIGRAMRFYARWCDDLVFTSVPEAFPAELPNRRAIGQGIDTSLFVPSTAPPTRDLLAVGRVAPSKRLDAAIRVVAELNRRGIDVKLDLVGPCHEEQKDYRETLLRLLRELGIEEQVRILGPARHDELPTVMVAYRAVLNLSDTAFDKSAGEAMAAGVPVITSNPRLAPIIPPDLREVLVVPANDTVSQADAVAGVLGWSAAQRAAVGARLRSEIADHHGIDTFFLRILAEIATHRGQRSGEVAA